MNGVVKEEDPPIATTFVIQMLTRAGRVILEALCPQQFHSLVIGRSARGGVPARTASRASCFPHILRIMAPAHAISRRSALKALGAAASSAAIVPWLSDEGLLTFARIQTARGLPAPKVLSKTQYATLEALTETIIPADDRSPGAKAARVADYIDLLLSEQEDSVTLQWLGGLAEIDEEAIARFKRPFVKLSAVERDRLVARISRNERSPESAVESFFVTVKAATVQGYYSSEIGIHQDLKYKGNQMLPEFVGCATEDGKDCPHCGQKHQPAGA